jgi:hypothetical protein
VILPVGPLHLRLRGVLLGSRTDSFSHDVVSSEFGRG